MIYDRYAVLDFNNDLTQFSGFKNKTGNGNYQYIRLGDQNIIDDKGQLKSLTQKSKIIIIGHGSEGGSSISNTDGSKRLSPKQIADYLSNNLTPSLIKPEAVFSNLGKKAAIANGQDSLFAPNGESTLMRRLTIQLCVCHAAESRGSEASFMEKLFHALADKHINANVVGYSSIVIMQHRPLPFHPLISNINKIFPKGEGSNDYSIDKRRLCKTIFNADNRNGKLYDKNWKEVYKMDILEQLRIEVLRDDWNSKGKTGFFLDKTKTPEGVRLLRGLFQNMTNLNDVAYDPTMHGNLAKEAYAIISKRLSKSFYVTSRNEATEELYRRYKIALEACV
jgi:hypothetical protein